jgi:hypothetical protein
MEKEFVPYELALELKHLGFNEPCFGSYVKLTETQNTFFMNDVVDEIDRETPLHKSLITKAPLYQQAFRWFREKYYLNYVIVKAESWFYTINGCNTQEGFNTYEEAELACLKKLIEIVKTK